MSELAAPIRLPAWSACFGDQHSSAAHPVRASAPLSRIGPFSVVNPAEGLDVATFGAPADPGVVLFDGYLFERQSLTGELGIDSRSSDAGIAAAAYHRWSSAAFDRLDGSYLLAIWDPRSQRLLLGHDALGHHPVYYAQVGETFWFGPNVLALSKAALTTRRLNRVSVALIALSQWPAAGETFFEGVHRLRAGRYLTIARYLTQSQTEYYAPWLRDGEPELTPAQVHERFEPALVAAVDRCMALSPRGIMLSGGLDSVTIAALAAEHATARHAPLVTAVSGRLNRDFRGEDVTQAATTEALGLRHLIAYESDWMAGRDDVERSQDAVAELPGPSRIYWVGGYMAFYRHTAAQGINVLLTGSGGDNWVSVGNAYAAECIRRFDIKALKRFVDSYTGTGGLTRTAAARGLLWSGGVRVLLDVLAAKWTPDLKAWYHRRRAASALPEWLCPDPRLKQQLIETRWRNRPSALTDDGHVPADLYRHEQRTQVNPYYVYEFEVGFHVESTCGLRLLSPYHDRHLVKLLNSIPPAVLLHGAKYKGLLREIAERRVPGIGLDQQSKAFEPGVVSTIYQTFREAMVRAWPGCDLSALESTGVIDVAGARRGLTGDTWDSLMTMSALMSAERWIRMHTSA